MLLIFVGQVLAIPFNSCQMDMDPSDSQPSMQHKMSMMPAMQMDDSIGMSCCDNDCDCPDGICISFAMISNSIINIQLFSIDSYTFSINSFELNQPISVFFHPPILG
jgi:hypothetical protein